MTKNRDLNGSWHGGDELEDKEWEDKLDDHIENNLSDPESLRNSRSSFYLQKASIAEGEVRPRLPGYHVPQTNGANDFIHLGDSDWVESRLELHRELSSQPLKYPRQITSSTYVFATCGPCAASAVATTSCSVTSLRRI